MKRRTFYTELAYILGLIVLAFSAALMEASDLGVSMIVAPAYLLHLKLSQTFAFFTFGMAEYTLQAALLIVMVMVLGRFRLYYLFSFITAVLYGLLLDGSMAIVALLGVSGMAGRITCFTAGVICCAVGVSLLFHTYIAPEVYELFVKEIAAKYGRNIGGVLAHIGFVDVRAADYRYRLHTGRLAEAACGCVRLGVLKSQCRGSGQNGRCQKRQSQQFCRSRQRCNLHPELFHHRAFLSSCS